MSEKVFTSTLKRFYSDLWYFHIPISQEAAVPFLDMNAKRVVCTLNEQESIHCALMPHGKGGWFININKEVRKRLMLEEGDEVSYTLKKDESKYGMPMPEEFEELLKLDDEGSRYFHALTPGKQRSLIFIVGKPKTSDTRIRKALAVVDYLKSTQGKLDYQELNEAMKRKRD